MLKIVCHCCRKKMRIKIGGTTEVLLRSGAKVYLCKYCRNAQPIGVRRARHYRGPGKHGFSIPWLGLSRLKIGW